MLLRSDFKWADSGYHHRQKPQPVQRLFKKSRKAPTPIVDRFLLYEVQHVVRSRAGKWGDEYLVKWKGYSQTENSWIPELPIHFRKTFPDYKQGLYDDSGSGSDDSESEASEDTDDEDSDDEDTDDEDSDAEEDDEGSEEEDERVCKRQRTAEVTQEKEALGKQCDAVAALLALSKAVVQLYDDTETDSD
jgi:hypothetical protein